MCFLQKYRTFLNVRNKYSGVIYTLETTNIFPLRSSVFVCKAVNPDVRCMTFSKLFDVH